jgi:hypothetical protein
VWGAGAGRGAAISPSGLIDLETARCSAWKQEREHLRREVHTLETIDPGYPAGMTSAAAAVVSLGAGELGCTRPSTRPGGLGAVATVGGRPEQLRRRWWLAGLHVAESASAFSSTTTGAGNERRVPACPVDHLLISEIRSRGIHGGNDEFIEIYNPTSTAT